MLVATKLVIFIESVGGNGHSSYEKLQCGLSMGRITCLSVHPLVFL